MYTSDSVSHVLNTVMLVQGVKKSENKTNNIELRSQNIQSKVFFFHFHYKDKSVKEDRLTWYLSWGTCKEILVNIAANPCLTHKGDL
jgi:hypothetical protein